MLRYVADEVEKTRSLFKSKEIKLVDQCQQETKAKESLTAEVTIKDSPISIIPLPIG